MCRKNYRDDSREEFYSPRDEYYRDDSFDDRDRLYDAEDPRGGGGGGGAGGRSSSAGGRRAVHRGSADRDSRGSGGRGGSGSGAAHSTQDPYDDLTPNYDDPDMTPRGGDYPGDDHFISRYTPPLDDGRGYQDRRYGDDDYYRGNSYEYDDDYEEDRYYDTRGDGSYSYDRNSYYDDDYEDYDYEDSHRALSRGNSYSPPLAGVGVGGGSFDSPPTERRFRGMGSNRDYGSSRGTTNYSTGSARDRDKPSVDADSNYPLDSAAYNSRSADYRTDSPYREGKGRNDDNMSYSSKRGDYPKSTSDYGYDSSKRVPDYKSSGEYPSDYYRGGSKPVDSEYGGPAAGDSPYRTGRSDTDSEPLYYNSRPPATTAATTVTTTSGGGSSNHPHSQQQLQQQQQQQQQTQNSQSGPQSFMHNR